MLSRLASSALLLICAAVSAFAGDQAPPWLQQATAAKVSVYDKDVPAVTLQNEQHVTVSPDGRVTTVTTFALRILRHEGRDYAFAKEFYETDAGKVRDMQAWLIGPSGEVKRYGKDQIIDSIEDDNDVYNESRFKMIDASKDADTGAVFGYQTTTEQRSVFSQDIFGFQWNRLPSAVSRYTLTVPTGWRASSVTFNHENIEPIISGETYAWELRNLSPIPRESSSPRVTSLAPRLVVNYFPPSDTRSASLQTYSNWADVSRWLTSLHDSQSAPDAAITEKARQLTAGINSELGKIRAIGRYVQDIRYISIQIGVSRGGGMRPHPAAEVFAKSYGDCKDKANLMRAMLKALDIQAYPVVIYAGDPTYVREEWASPNQFNHCIIAIKISDQTQTASVITHGRLGRLLIFDATDDDTPVGDLPEHEQGSFALVIAGDDGALMRMPVTSPESNGLDRQLDATLGADGSLTASVRQSALGSSAVSYRRMFRHETRPDYLKIIESWISSGATAAKLNNVEPRDNSAEGRFNLDINFSAPQYGQLMQGRLLVFKPAIVSRNEVLALTEINRKYPVVLASRTFTETARVKLPTGFDVDELPDAVNLDTAFGRYATSYDVKDGQLVFKRTLVQKAMTVPVEQYASVRSFFEKIRAAEQAPVVLAKK